MLCQCLVAVNISTNSEALIWFLDGQTHHFSHNNPIIDSTVNITDRAQVTLVSINDTHIISVLKLNVQSGDVVVCKNGFLGTAYNKTVTLTVAGEHYW